MDQSFLRFKLVPFDGFASFAALVEAVTNSKADFDRRLCHVPLKMEIG